MNEPGTPTGAGLRLRVIQLWLALCVPAALIGASCPYLLLSLTPDQWRAFLELSAVSAVVVVPVMLATLGHLVAPVLTCLPDGVEVGASGAEDPRVVRRAFAAVMDLPRRAAVFGGAGWLLPAVLVGLGMSLRFDSWNVFESAVVLLAGTVAGFGSGAILHFGVKRVAEPVRDALAAEITDPEERRGLIRPISVKRKLLVSALGLTVAPAAFALLLAHAQAVRSVESLAVRWQEDVLSRLLEERADDAGLSFEALSSSPEIRGPVTVWELDLAEPHGIPFGPKVVAQLREEIALGESGGSTTTLDSNYVLAWRHVEGDRVLVAATASRMLSPAAWRSGTGIVLLLGLFMVMAVTLAVLLASDLGRMTRALRAEVARLASGDLRPGRTYESEDELGDLMRSFQAMAASLRETVGRVSEAADRVEATAGEMTSVSDDLAEVTAAQVEGLERVSASVGSISGQVQGIAESIRDLNRAMEESRSSILELGAAGEELNETATVLTDQVEEVSSSIEEMVRSVCQVSGSVDALAEAAVATSTSMEEMATSMSEVDSSADETGRLFEQVVDRAESGQEKVRQTIAGMEEIREATETAERVIRNLGSRTDEIGAIVDVIDDVADETNLLALNAAIIAAQAGEHGRAFSVVADQIKDLADRVLTSTKEIGGLIRAVQAEGSNAIGAIERGTRSVAGGVDLSAEAGVSLEEITRASRESGVRIEAIVTAVREQAKAAGHVVSLMERVRGGVEEIRASAAEQDRGNEVVYRGSVAMQQVAERVRATTDEQARGSGIIRERSEEARDAVERIHRVMQEQARASAAAVETLKSVVARTRANEESARRLDGATQGLLKQSAALREDLQRFRI